MKKLLKLALLVATLLNLAFASDANIIDISKLTVNEARRLAPIILDAMNIPDGDIAIPS